MKKHWFPKSIMILFSIFALISCMEPLEPSRDDVGYNIKEVKRYENIFGFNPKLESYFFDEKYIFIANDNELQIYSFDSTDIRKIATANLAVKCSKLCYQKGLIIISDLINQIQIVDVSDPANPILGLNYKVSSAIDSLMFNMAVSDFYISLVHYNSKYDTIPVLKVLEIQSANSIIEKVSINYGKFGNLIPLKIIGKDNCFYALNLKTEVKDKIGNKRHDWSINKIDIMDINNLIIEEPFMIDSLDGANPDVKMNLKVKNNYLFFTKSFGRSEDKKYTYIYNIENRSPVLESTSHLYVIDSFNNFLFAYDVDIDQKLMYYSIDSFQSMNLTPVGYHFFNENEFAHANNNYIYLIGNALVVLKYSIIN